LIHRTDKYKEYEPWPFLLLLPVVLFDKEWYFVKIEYGDQSTVKPMTTDHTNILIELNRAVKTLNFYPKGHPNLEQILSDFLTLLKDATSSQGEITLRIDSKNIIEDGKPISPNNAAISALAKQLFLKKIKVLKVNSHVSSKDIDGFLALLTKEPHAIFKEGGAVMVLAKQNVTGILLNETSYEQLKELQENMDDDKTVEFEDKNIAEAGSEETSENEPEPEPEPEAEATEEKKEDTLKELLHLLSNERSTIGYKDLSIKIIGRADLLIADNELNDILPVLYLFLKHTLPKYMENEEIRSLASESLLHFLSREVILFLVDKVSSREEPNRTAIQYLLLKAEDDAVDPLLDALSETPVAHKAHYLTRTLVRFGDNIRDKINQRLQLEERAITIQMIALLGELGGEKSMEPLIESYAMNDLRIKKAVLKSLARITSEDSSKILRDAIKEGNRALIGQAIISLAMHKDSASVELIGDMALKGDIELKKEAIKALGISGDEMAVPYLKKVLIKKSWFGKEISDDQKILAILSLGKIGGHIAIETIQGVYKDSKGNIYNTCKRVLEGSKADDR